MTPPRDPHEEPIDPITERGEPPPGLLPDGTLNIVDPNEPPVELLPDPDDDDVLPPEEDERPPE
jgi:hypothetical protein